jgi:hypothetical protein
MGRSQGGRLREREAEWMELCRQAAVEQDPKKTLELTRQINELLIGKQRRLDQKAESPEK